MALMRRAVRIIANIFKHRQLFPMKNYSDKIPESEEQKKEKFTLESKSAIINGGASGIGYAIAKEFLKNGLSQLTITDINPEQGERVTETLTQDFGENKVVFLDANISNAKQLDDAYRKAIQFHDVPEIIINSAGIMNDTKWEDQIKTNMAGCVVGTLLGLQYMSKSSNGEGGIIINIGSILGIIPSSGFPLHTMTQFGVCGFTKALGCGNHISRTGVKIFAVCPGLTNTPMLRDAPKNSINERFSQEFMEEIEGSTPQKPESVAKGLIEILDEAKPGSVWVVENDGRPYEVTYPGKVLEIRKEKDTSTTADVSASVKN